ncbi:2-polyprenyl-3-methyl-6-methoxy-1,4-benzoquinone monooxygenase [Algiphilus sp. W345]|uniref:3-demethoxyubiquinol 3-hydroxylase n=1 Tax=Banduia mediterranea TaxID=3075609 RepID=A0ABU2WH99_9GAMM|nr:2-polyprenyl-3-methyl-6-methoxy-1,4-benzoquinone monooxygenase [Algiphilus sp. W345]MDT0496651.1 2-polyprenyl-3-methyl-6-methoxy-1,4-benzoquinone monooxygenase [Algiphilus sp. W345]
MTAAQPPRRALPARLDTDRAGAAVPAVETRLRSVGLMRINHAGEVAAQALYHGQSMTARDAKTRQHMLSAAMEEKDHLAWCEARLAELGARPSRLQAFWYGGSFAIGALAGLAGDRWSLGFVNETERQVAEHLDEHIAQLSDSDVRSRTILEQMRLDEQRHGDEAAVAGGRPPPAPVRRLMRRVAAVMKWTAGRF